MRTILVTGPIGSGKSAVCRHLESKGIPVYDSDSRTKRLYETVPGLRETIERELDIEFKDLAIIFQDPAKKKKLEDIVYPLVAADIAEWKAGLDGCVTAVIESANALGKPMFESLYDKVMIVTAPLSQRVLRNPKAASRNALQSFEGAEADWVVENVGSIEQLYEKIDELAL